MVLKYFNLRGLNKLLRNKKCISFSTAFLQNGQQRSSLFMTFNVSYVIAKNHNKTDTTWRLIVLNAVFYK